VSSQLSAFVVDTKTLPRAKVGGVDDPAVRWQGAFAAYGGRGTTASSTIVYEIEPGGRLGWHTDAAEETQYILAGTGELRLETAPNMRSGPAVSSCSQRRAVPPRPWRLTRARYPDYSNG
jgi:hypothetical protein